MTKLFIQHGGVFLPAGVTLEEIKELEKESTELKNRISNSITELNELKTELNELKSQIEKNKCCETCRSYDKERDDCKNDEPCNDYDKWAYS